MLEWWPDDGGRKNRALLWDKFTSADPNQWFGPIGLSPMGPSSWSREERREFVDDFKTSFIGHLEGLEETASKQPLFRSTEWGTQKIYEGVIWVTPKEYEEEMNALIYYGTLGMIDPTIPGEVKLYRMRGWSFRAAVGLTFGRAFFGFTLFMYIVDPHDKREGGVAETEWYKKWTDLENYSLPQGW
jgi:hypothetical protein